MKNFVVTINRTCGSGGSIVGKIVADKLCVPLYSKTNLLSNIEDCQMQSKEVFQRTATKLQEMANMGSFVVIGRCADYILKDEESETIRVFISASDDFRIKQEAAYMRISDEDALDRINMADRERATYYFHNTEQEWLNPKNYDICLNTSSLSYEECANIIIAIVKSRI